MDEHVLRGNTGILKCHIPSFVADFVSVSSWIEDEKTEIYGVQNGFGGSDLGTYTTSSSFLRILYSQITVASSFNNHFSLCLHFIEWRINILENIDIIQFTH